MNTEKEMLIDKIEREWNKHVKQPIQVQKKPNNNEPCPCGSGMKYKKCCKNLKTEQI